MINVMKSIFERVTRCCNETTELPTLHFLLEHDNMVQKELKPGVVLQTIKALPQGSVVGWEKKVIGIRKTLYHSTDGFSSNFLFAY